MPELSHIIPYCCSTGTYYMYSNGLAEGYILGIATMFIITILVDIIDNMKKIYKHNEEEADKVVEEEVEDEVDEVDEVEEEVEEDAYDNREEEYADDEREDDTTDDD